MLKPPKDHPFYRPLWRRVAICVVTIAWAVFEFAWSGDGFWQMIAGATAAYCVWAFLIAYKPTEDGGPLTPTDGGGSPPAA